MQIKEHLDLDDELLERFEFYCNHALEILTQAFPNEWEELKDCLRGFEMTVEEICAAGGNETRIPKKFDDACTLWAEEKSASQAICTLSSTHGSATNGANSPMSPTTSPF